MIEYLTYVAMAVVAIRVAGIFVGKGMFDIIEMIQQKIEPLKSILDFISNLHQWWTYYNKLQQNIESLKGKTTRLQDKVADITKEVEFQEHRTRKERTRVVDNWLNDTRKMDDEVRKIQEDEIRQMYRFFKPLYRCWLGYCAERKIQDIDELLNTGTEINASRNYVRPTERKLPLLVGELVGQMTSNLLDSVFQWSLSLNGSWIRGIYGVEGVGKTALVPKIYNKVLERKTPNIYIVHAGDQDTVEGLQEKIRVQLGIDFERENESILKASRLQYTFKKLGNFILILDGLHRYYDLQDFGIQDNLDQCGGKLVLTSRDERVCRRMGCYGETLSELKPLLEDEAVRLFDKERGSSPSLSQNLDNTKEEIIRRCGGIPRKIQTVARELKGETDLAVWRNKLREMKSSSAS